MNRCLITYEPCGEKTYSMKGLRALSNSLERLEPIGYSAREQRREAIKRAAKMSIQGLQPKLSVILKIKAGRFEVVDKHGTYIIKPQIETYEMLPENEDLTMKMARSFGIEVPLTGLVLSKDGSRSFFIKRFDRYGRKKKRHVEDFAQLTGNTRDTKYNWSMEKVVNVIGNYCTFPLPEKQKLLRRVLFSFIAGNEDMHLKNFSLISRNDKIELSPAYDLLNTTISMPSVIEELALPLQGKKSKFKATHFFNYYARERLGLSHRTIDEERSNIADKHSELISWINRSFLSEELKVEYIDIVNSRIKRLLD